MEKIKVFQSGQWGVKVAENPDLWLNYAKGSGLNKDSFKPGAEYSVEIVENGKYRNIKSVEGVTTVAPVASKPAFKKAFAKKEVSASTAMTKEEWAAKDRSQMIGGLSHDAVQLVLAHVNSGKSVEELVSVYEEALTSIISLRDRVK